MKLKEARLTGRPMRYPTHAHLFKALRESVDDRAVQLLGVLLHKTSTRRLLCELREQLSQHLCEGWSAVFHGYV